MIENIGKNSIVVDIFDLHNCSFLNEKEVFTFGPSIAKSITINLPFLEKLLILMK